MSPHNEKQAVVTHLEGMDKVREVLSHEEEGEINKQI